MTVLVKIKRLWNASPLATVVLAIALTAAVALSAQTIARCIYWMDPAHRTQTVEAWMTPGYIANSWGMPRHELTETLHLPKMSRDGKPHTLKQLAENMDMSVEQLVSDAQAAVSAFAEQRDAQ